MKFIPLLISALVLAAAVYVGGTHGVISPKVPAIAALFDPFAGAWQQAEPLEPTSTTVQIPATVQGEVVIDQRGVPHIFADKMTDVAYIQGYLHAQDRLFQMDIATRASSGRLAEVLGTSVLERDKTQRRKGILQAARQLEATWLAHPETSGIITAYVQGVNAYLANLKPKDYPLEYKILGFEPEGWTALKSAIFVQSMAETLCFRNEDIPTSNSRAVLGDELFAHLFPNENPQQSPVIPAGTAWDFEPIPVSVEELPAPLGHSLPFEHLPQSPEGIGSNNWAVSGTKTASGAPLLANDPHLNLTLPSIWYEIQLHCEGMNVHGVSLPTLPGVVIGFNAHQAWGITNVGHDVLDWYKISWTDTTRNHYVLDGQPVATEWKMDSIWVRGEAQPIVVRTPWTQFGPVVYEQPDDIHYNLAMRWLVHAPNSSESANNLTAFLRLGTSTQLSEYQQAIRGFDYPASNIVYADQQGNIALTAMGHYPIRQPQQGRFVQDGSRSQNNWQGFIPFEQVPRVANPPRQFVASANQTSTDATYPYYYLGGFDDFRGRYINRRLAAMDKVTPKDMMALQYDSHSLRAEEALPLLLAALEGQSLDENASSAKQLLTTWNYSYTADSKAAIVFRSWFDSLRYATFDEIHAHDTDKHPMEFPEDWRLIELMGTNPSDAIFDIQATSEKEDMAAIAKLALTQAATKVMPLIAAGSTWNTHRDTRIPHLAKLPGFDSGLLTSDGAKDTPNALSAANGPSWRMIVSLERPIKAWAALPGGSSGNAGSPFYAIGVEGWAKGEYVELTLFESPEAVGTGKRLVFGR